MSNSSNEVWLKVKLPQELHGRIRRLAFEGGETLGEIVGVALEGYLGWRTEPIKRGPPESKGIGQYELAKEHQAKKAAGGSIPPTGSKHPGGSINHMNTLICCVCGKEIQSEGYTYNKEKKPICQPCAHKVAGV